MLAANYIRSKCVRKYATLTAHAFIHSCTTLIHIRAARSKHILRYFIYIYFILHEHRLFECDRPRRQKTYKIGDHSFRMRIFEIPQTSHTRIHTQTSEAVAAVLLMHRARIIIARSRSTRVLLPFLHFWIN